LVTAARYRLRLVAVVHNDGKYGAIRNLQRRKHESRFIDTDLGNPDFVKLADACGVPGERAADAATLAAALRRALGRDEPTLIEVPDEWRSLRDG
jgi:thiamine pyrophosphate-dependent acetolactate synthase large subunit-like protein